MSVKKVFRKDRNKWQVTYWLEHKRHRPLFDSEREADDFVRKVKLGFSRRSENSITLDTAIKSYFNDVSKKRKSLKSQKSDKRYFNLLCGFMERDREIKYLSEIKLQDLEAFQIWLSQIDEFLGEPVSMGPATINRAFNSIRHLFKKHVQWGNIEASPCLYLDNLKSEENARRAITADEFQRLMGFVHEADRPTVQFMYYTGAPNSCIERLTFNDVDFEKRTFAFRREKGGRLSRIDLPMIDEVYELLIQQRIRFGSGPVFRTRRGHPIKADWLSKLGTRAIRAAGLRGVVLYSLRHALATDMTDANVATEVARQAMGHRSISTTQRYSKNAKSKTLTGALSLVRGGLVAG